MTTVNPTFHQGALRETLSLAATGSTSWILVPKGVQATTFHVIHANTDALGTLSFDGCNDLADAPYTPLPFEDPDGTIDTDGYAVAASVNTVFKVTAGLRHLRLTYTRTSGGTGETATIAINHVYG